MTARKDPEMVMTPYGMRQAPSASSAAQPNETTQAAPQVEAPSLAAYYYGFAPTGIDAVDLILAAVAAAGHSFHHTEDWNDPIYDGPSAVERIQAAAQDAADAIRSEAAELTRLRKECEETLAAMRAVLAHVEDDKVRMPESMCRLCFTYRKLLRDTIDRAEGRQS